MLKFKKISNITYVLLILMAGCSVVFISKSDNVSVHSDPQGVKIDSSNVEFGNISNKKNDSINYRN